MDTGRGKFAVVQGATHEELIERMEKMEAKYPNHGGWFRVGEEVELKGSRFRVKAVKPNTITLKLLPKSKQGTKHER